MVPETLGAVVALLLLVGPGLAFSAVRERRRPVGGPSTFREVSEAALIGLLCSFGTLALLWIAGALVGRGFPDPGAWLVEGFRYVASHLGTVAWFVGAWAALSTAAAVIVAWRLFKDGGRIEPRTNSWFELFAGQIIVPPGAEPMVRVRLRIHRPDPLL